MNQATALDLTDERDRILKLLEEGKISAAESSELMSALALGARQGQPAFAKRRAGAPSPLMLACAALLLAGFFMPWFSVDLDKEMRDAAQEVTGMIPNIMGGEIMSGMMNGMIGTLADGEIVKVPGLDIPYGLGWSILLLGLASAGALALKRELGAAKATIIAMVSLSAGTAVLVYLACDKIPSATYGLAAVVAAYCGLWAGTLADRRREHLAREPQGALGMAL